jgi:hypothetical protein
MAIFHVGLLYKIVAVSWSLLMFRHFVRILRIAPDVQANHNLHNRRSVPRLALANIVTIWAVFLVVGGVVLSPRDPSGAPDPMLAHVFAGCGGLLLLATAYGVVAHLVTEWRNMSAAINRQFYLISAVMDTCVAFAALAAISFVVVRG